MADVEKDIWCIDPQSIKKAITKRTKVIIPVHLYGHPADMDEIMNIAKEYGPYVIEDAAEAHGAEYKGKKVGSLGYCAIFSFYGNKIITTGEGGMLVTNDKNLYERAKFLKDHAMSRERRYYHPEIGFNYRMTNVQAALGLAQMERIKELVGKKRQIFSWYKECMEDIEGTRLNPEKEWAKNVYWMVCLILEKDFGITRDKLMIKLKENGIDTRPFFYPLSQMPMYASSKVNPVAFDISQKGLNLPSGVNLEKKEVKWITESIKEVIGGL